MTIRERSEEETMTAPRSILWDGKDFAAVQMLLAEFRTRGEPVCRIPGGDMTQMEVFLGLPGKNSAGGWTPVPVGWVIAVSDGGIISLEDKARPVRVVHAAGPST
jgi:hypothetical protein